MNRVRVLISIFALLAVASVFSHNNVHKGKGYYNEFILKNVKAVEISLEQAHGYIENRSNSNFEQGSEENAVTRIMKQYGAVPMEALERSIK